MSPTSRAATTGAPPQRNRGMGPLPTVSRGARPDSAAIPVPRPLTDAEWTPREPWIPVRATQGSEDAGGASAVAQWQGPAGRPGFRWQDPGWSGHIAPAADR
jgi:hypothetical protein